MCMSRSNFIYTCMHWNLTVNNSLCFSAHPQVSCYTQISGLFTGIVFNNRDLLWQDSAQPSCQFYSMNSCCRIHDHTQSFLTEEFTPKSSHQKSILLLAAVCKRFEDEICFWGKHLRKTCTYSAIAIYDYLLSSVTALGKIVVLLKLNGCGFFWGFLN